MKISELMAKLEEIKNKEGDLDVCYEDWSRGANRTIENIELVKEEDCVVLS